MAASCVCQRYYGRASPGLEYRVPTRICTLLATSESIAGCSLICMSMRVQTWQHDVCALGSMLQEFLQKSLLASTVMLSIMQGLRRRSHAALYQLVHEHPISKRKSVYLHLGSITP
eukprot:1559690-Rhodomonas_salina.1